MCLRSMHGLSNRDNRSIALAELGKYFLLVGATVVGDPVAVYSPATLFGVARVPAERNLFSRQTFGQPLFNHSRRDVAFSCGCHLAHFTVNRGAVRSPC